MNLVMQGSVWAIRVFDYRGERSSARQQFARLFDRGAGYGFYDKMDYQTERLDKGYGRSFRGGEGDYFVPEYYPVDKL